MCISWRNKASRSEGGCAAAGGGGSLADSLREGALIALRHRQPVEEAVQLGGEDLAAHYGVFAQEQVNLDTRLAGGVVEHLIGVPLDPFPGVLLQVEALLRLEGAEAQLAAARTMG